jgi:hypothetical protein
MSQSVRYTIRFDNLDASDSGRAAEGLRRSLQDADPTIQARRVRTDPETLDFGTVLEVTLATPAFIELAKGVANWLSRAHSSKLTIVGPDGSTVVENIGASEAADLAEKLQAKHGNR